jgi:uncharacterized membrane protein YhaH (DUF805 family)
MRKTLIALSAAAVMTAGMIASPAPARANPAVVALIVVVAIVATVVTVQAIEHRRWHGRHHRHRHG